MMYKGKAGFTLIELIIVAVIIGILAMVAIPRYFVNIKKSRKAAVVTNLGAIRDAIMAYNAATMELPTVSGGSSIIVTIDSEQTLNVGVPADYTFDNPIIYAPAVDGCSYTMNLGTGVVGTGSSGCP